MEQIDVLFIAFVIFVIITSLYIAYLKSGVNFLIEMLAKQQLAIEELVKATEVQAGINKKQGEVNNEIVRALDKVVNFPTGGRKQSN